MPERDPQAAAVGRPGRAPSPRVRLPATVFRSGLGIVVPLVSGPDPAVARPPRQDATPAPAAARPGSERLTEVPREPLPAPIALDPDTLLTQRLMASTWPLGIMQARRWRHRSANAAGAALEQTLLDQPWDATATSLMPLPDVLTLMNDRLERTRQVGDAVLAPPQDVFNAIQVLRGRTEADGARQSGQQRTVTQTVTTPAAALAAAQAVEPRQVITIAPTQPDTVSPPACDPLPSAQGDRRQQAEAREPFRCRTQRPGGGARWRCAGSRARRLALRPRRGLGAGARTRRGSDW